MSATYKEAASSDHKKRKMVTNNDRRPLEMYILSLIVGEWEVGVGVGSNWNFCEKKPQIQWIIVREWPKIPFLEVLISSPFIRRVPPSYN